MPTESQPPSEPSTASPAPSGAKRIGQIALVGVLLLAGAAVAREAFLRYSAEAPKYVAPADRPVRNAPYIVSPEDVVDLMVEWAQIQPTDLVYDLGCGDGRLVIAACKKHGCRGIGVEIDHDIAEEAKQNVEAAGLADKVTILEQDVFKLDFSDGDVVVVYLLPKQLEALVPQFQQMRPGSRIVSHDFEIAGHQHDQVEHFSPKDLPKTIHAVYLYTTPLKPIDKPAQGR